MSKCSLLHSNFVSYSFEFELMLPMFCVLGCRNFAAMNLIGWLLFLVFWSSHAGCCYGGLVPLLIGIQNQRENPWTGILQTSPKISGHIPLPIGNMKVNDLEYLAIYQKYQIGTHVGKINT